MDPEPQSSMAGADGANPSEGVLLPSVPTPLAIPMSPIAADLLALATGETLQSSQSLLALTSDSSPLHPKARALLVDLIQGCQTAGAIGGGGDAVARAIAQAYAPSAILDLVRRAQETRGRDADRLWGRVLAAAGLSTAPVPPTQVNIVNYLSTQGVHRRQLPPPRGTGV